MIENTNWLTIGEAAEQLGYNHIESLRYRLRTLRKRGLVADLGNPPKRYPAHTGDTTGMVILQWVNPVAFMVSGDLPANLFDNKQGGRPPAGNP